MSDQWEESCRERGGEVRTIKNMGGHPEIQVCDFDGEDTLEEVRRETLGTMESNRTYRNYARDVDNQEGIFAFKGDFYDGEIHSIDGGRRVKLELENDEGEQFVVRYPSDHYFGRHDTFVSSPNVRIHPRHPGARKYDHRYKDGNTKDWRFGKNSTAEQGSVRFRE